MLKVAVTPADTQDRDTAAPIIGEVKASPAGGRLEKVLADGGYAGEATREAVARHGVALEIVKTPDAVKAKKQFIPVPKRWVGERTNSWLVKCRRLHRDNETTIRCSRAFVYLCVSWLGLGRLVRKNKIPPVDIVP